MASNLDMFMDIRDTLEKRDQELKKLYGEIVQLQEENSQNVKNDLPLNVFMDIWKNWTVWDVRQWLVKNVQLFVLFRIWLGKL